MIDSFVEGFQRAVSAKPEEQAQLLNQLKVECIGKTPELFEALLTLTPREHWHELYALFKAFAGVTRAWSKLKKT